MYVERNDIRVINISANGRQNCLLHLLSLEFRVLYFPPKAAIDQEPWFTGTIEHRFSNSVDQSESVYVVSQLFYKGFAAYKPLGMLEEHLNS